MSEPIISVSGLRGIVGESLTPDVAVRYAAAFAAEIAAGPIVITRDGRDSGPMLAEALCRGLTALGRDVVDCGVAATPTTGVLVRQLKAAGGIQISASHNPAQYNGLKLLSAEGRVIPEAAGAKVLDRYRRPTGSSLRPEPGKLTTCSDTVSQHARLILDTVKVERIRQRRFRVLVDSNHGAGGLLARMLLTELGCTVTILGETPDGAFERRWGRCRLLPGPRRGSTGGDRCRGALPGRGVHAGHLCRPSLAAAERTDCHELLHQPHESGPGREVRSAVFSLGSR